jgi:hypothetical protein
MVVHRETRREKKKAPARAETAGRAWRPGRRSRAAHMGRMSWLVGIGGGRSAIGDGRWAMGDGKKKGGAERRQSELTSH